MLRLRWNVPSPPLTGPDGFIHALTYSPNESMLAGGNSAGQTWVWNIGDRDHPYPLAILQLSDTEIWTLWFGSGGKDLIAASGDIYPWDTDPERVAQRICTNAETRSPKPSGPNASPSHPTNRSAHNTPV